MFRHNLNGQERHELAAALSLTHPFVGTGAIAFRSSRCNVRFGSKYEATAAFGDVCFEADFGNCGTCGVPRAGNLRVLNGVFYVAFCIRFTSGATASSASILSAASSDLKKSLGPELGL